MGNDKYTVVNAEFVIELKREPYKVIPISRHQAAFFQRSAFELFKIR